MKPTATSFKLFSALQPLLADLACVSGIEKYWGHTPGSSTPTGTKEELLTDHVRRVNDCCLALIKAHGLEPVIDGLIADILNAFNATGAGQKSVGDFIKLSFLAAVAFHDYGKLNENYQVHLGNTVSFKPVENVFDSGHSILSAHLWIEWALKQSETITDDEADLDLLTGLIYDFADVILNHHASGFYLREMRNKEAFHWQAYAAQMGLDLNDDCLIEEKESFQKDVSKACLETAETKAAFARYALLKLCFSLLTASDYLATLGYMTEGGDYTKLSKKDLGVFTPEETEALLHRFRKASYNAVVYDQLEATAAQPWETLQERSNENLNRLRQKLLAEVVLKIREAPDAFLYYLEAPTGAGKTNLSLAIALELMAQDKRLGKLFYVFPFTTLITQTHKDLKEKLGLDESTLIQLHSKAEAQEKTGDEGAYGAAWTNHVDRLFVQYPITLLSHVRFFDILKSNRKEVNYLLHRLANSVVIIDEVQSYSPKLWKHVHYFLSHYARRFNIRVVVMSATLPKLHLLGKDAVVELIEKPQAYFRNANFSGRVQFNFDWLRKKRPLSVEDKGAYLEALADEVAEKCEAFAVQNNDSVAGIIEFITKKSASAFAGLCSKHPVLAGYEIRLLSGTILEPRRKEIVAWLKKEETRTENPRILLICTQVVEAGVDIDMDIGFKDSSLIDSDEQLAGRVNRNAKRTTATVHLFNLDSESNIYKGDPRLKAAQELGLENREKILSEKDFNLFYENILQDYIRKEGGLLDTFTGYEEKVRGLAFPEIDRDFKLIESDSESVFIPLDLDAGCFSEKEMELLTGTDALLANGTKVSGEKVFNHYIETLRVKSGDFIKDREARHRFQSVLSKFTISVFPELAQKIRANVALPYPNWQDYGFVYLGEPDKYYSYETGMKPDVDFSAADFW